MRAVYCPNLEDNLLGNFFVENEVAKHLNVARVKTNERVLILNGRGLKVFARVGDIKKDRIELIVESIENGIVEKSKSVPLISFAIATPKKEAFEDIIRIAIELGVKNIYPLTSQYSQYNFFETERMDRILENALIQSNNPFLPIIHPQTQFDDFINELSIPLYFFNSNPKAITKKRDLDFSDFMVLIGPEGGFSPEEESKLLNNLKVISIHLPTPILRSTTATATAMGYLLAKHCKYD